MEEEKVEVNDVKEENNTSFIKKLNNITIKLDKVLKVLILLLVLVLMITICIKAFYKTAYFNTSYNDATEKTSYKYDNVFLNLVYVSIFLIVIYILNKILTRNKIKFLIPLLVIGLFIAFVCVVLYLKPVPVADQGQVMILGEAFLKDVYNLMLSPGSYLDMFPYQFGYSITIGIIFKLFNLIKIFNLQNYQYIQVLNCIVSIVNIILLYKIGKEIVNEKNTKTLNILKILLFFFSIYFITINTYVYGNLPGLMFSLISYLNIIYFIKNKKIINVFIAGITIYLAYFLKSNYEIFLIAIILTLGLDLLKNINLKTFISIILIIVIFFCGILGNKLLFKIIVKGSNPLGVPMVTYLYMAWSEQYTFSAGWYTGEVINAYNRNNFDHIKTAEESKSLLAGRFEAFREDLPMFFDYVTDKFDSTWINPTFQSLWTIIPGYLRVDGDEGYKLFWTSNSFLMGISDAESSEYLVLERIFDTLEISIFLFAIVGIIKNLKNNESYFVLIPITFIGGLMFHLLWETKAYYVLFYYFLLLPYSAIGINTFYNFIRKKIFKKEIEDDLDSFKEELEKEKTSIKKINKILNKNRSKLKQAMIIMLIIFNIILVLLVFATRYLYMTFNINSFDGVIFELTQPLDGTDSKLVYSGIFNIFVLGIISYLILRLIFFKFVYFKLLYKDKLNKEEDIEKFLNDHKKSLFIKKLVIILLFISISLTYIIVKNRFVEFIKYNLNDSTFIEDNYVDPREVKLTFPENKRNLIYIFVESIENAWTSKENGGIFDEDLIKELREISEENYNFSNTDTSMGGPIKITGTDWTVGSLVAQTGGVPLKVSVDGNVYGDVKKFTPGIYSIGEVLYNNGYYNEFMCGSDIKFGGRDKYFHQHGKYRFFDYNYAVKNDLYHFKYIGWGFTDNFLFDYAKDELIKLSSKDKPFNLSILTVDTHHPDGIECFDCYDKFDRSDNVDRYKKIIECSSKRIAEFVRWVQEQDFYENTTIILVGDHPTMSTLFNDNYPNNYIRTNYNVIINPALPESINIEDVNFRNRLYTQMDWYPTTLSAIGVEIEGDRLGLGTNLFSNKKTLVEEYGLIKFVDEMANKSSFYNNNILKLNTNSNKK